MNDSACVYVCPLGKVVLLVTHVRRSSVWDECSVVLWDHRFSPGQGRGVGEEHGVEGRTGPSFPYGSRRVTPTVVAEWPEGQLRHAQRVAVAVWWLVSVLLMLS